MHTFTCYSAPYFQGQTNIFSYISSFQGNHRTTPLAKVSFLIYRGIHWLGIWVLDPILLHLHLLVEEQDLPCIVCAVCVFTMVMHTDPAMALLLLQCESWVQWWVIFVYAPQHGRLFREGTHHWIIFLSLVPRSMPFPSSSNLTYMSNSLRLTPLYFKAVK